jgi:hypothetical protein
MTMMMSQQQLLAAAACSTLTASTASPADMREMAAAADQDAAVTDVGACRIALSLRSRTIDMRRDSHYYLTAVASTRPTCRRRISAIASQRSAGGSIQRKKGFDNVFARRRVMNSGPMICGWAALVRLHPAA